MIFQNKFSYLNRLAGVSLLTLANIFVAQSASAQTASCDGFQVTPLSFSGATLSSGTALQSGAVYDYVNVAPGVNGQVEILGTFNGATLNAIDNDNGLTASFQPEVTPNPAGNGYVAFRVSFINAASGQPEPLTFAATQIDIDGDNQTLREFVEFNTSLAQYTLNATTDLLVNASGPTSPNFSRFEAATSTVAPGVDPTAQENIVRAIYTNASSYDFNYGTLDAGATTRLASVGFECPVLPNPVNTIPTADLVTVKSLAASSSAAPEVGDVVTYEITITNNGPDTATNVDLTDSLPAGLTATPNNGTVTDGTYIGGDWSIPFLQSGGTAILTLEGTVDAGQGGNTITNTLVSPAVSDIEDPTTAGDDLTETVIVESSVIPAPTAPVITSCAYGEPFEFDNSESIVFSTSPSNNQLFTAQSVQNGTTFDFTILDKGPTSNPLLTPISGTGHSQSGGNATNGGIRLLGTLNGTVPIEVDATVDISGGFVTEIEYYAHDLENNETVVYGTTNFVPGTLGAHPGAVVGLDQSANTVVGTADNTNAQSNRSALATYQNSNGLTSLTQTHTIFGGRLVTGFALGTYCASIVEAIAETFPAITESGGVTTSILASDTLNGQIIDPADVTFTPGAITGPDGNPSTAITVDADGIVTVPAGIAAGDYTIEYEICDTVNPTNCSTATETITVTANPELSLTKTADDNTNRALGDTITYTYTAENTGNIDITDVTVSDVHNGSGPLSSIAIDALTNTSGNSSDDAADNDIDVLAPGDSVTFEASYVVTLADLIAGSNITNTATLTGGAAAGTLTEPTANESVSLLTPVTPPPLPPLNPGVCGGVLAEAYLLDGMGIGAEQFYQLASGSPTHDPDVFFGELGAEPAYVKNADGSVVYYFDGEAPLQTVVADVDTGNLIGNITSVNGRDADQTDAAEFWRITARIDGVPGETYNYTLNNGGAHEFLHYWLQDSAGNVIDSTLGDPNTANGWLYGTGQDRSTSSDNGATSISALQTTPISYTIPASSPDGVVYLRVMVLDPQASWGRLDFANAPECPAPSLSMEKVADNPGPYTAGDVITYTYTVTNDGNQVVRDVVVNDTHNGSNPAPVPVGETLLTDIAPAGDSTDAGGDGSWDVLAPGDAVTFTGTYTVTQTDAENL